MNFGNSKKEEEIMLEVVEDTLIDGLKLVPFLFITYLFMEILEHRMNNNVRQKIVKAGKTGPVWGGILGVLPQCGFSTAAASLYSGGIITVGTLIAVFMSTSDEMLPILISRASGAGMILKILAVKVVIAVISGLVAEYVYVKIFLKKEREPDIHTVCEEEHCHCEDGSLVSAIKHTIKITIYIIIISFALNVITHFWGIENIEGLFSSVPVIGVLLSALIGLIPNCASSVVITEFYLDGVISAGSMMAGLLVNAGVGMLVLFRLNRHIKQNLSIVLAMYFLGVFWGFVIQIAGITF